MASALTLVVHKFDGSSVADALCISVVAEILVAEASAPERIFFIVYAVKGIINKLLFMIDSATSRDPNAHTEEELDDFEALHRSTESPGRPGQTDHSQRRMRAPTTAPAIMKHLTANRRRSANRGAGCGRIGASTPHSRKTDMQTTRTSYAATTPSRNQKLTMTYKRRKTVKGPEQPQGTCGYVGGRTLARPRVVGIRTH